MPLYFRVFKFTHIVFSMVPSWLMCQFIFDVHSYFSLLVFLVKTQLNVKIWIILLHLFHIFSANIFPFQFFPVFLFLPHLFHRSKGPDYPSSVYPQWVGEILGQTSVKAWRDPPGTDNQGQYTTYIQHKVCRQHTGNSSTKYVTSTQPYYQMYHWVCAVVL